jgi:hypothetical protein
MAGVLADVGDLWSEMHGEARSLEAPMNQLRRLQVGAAPLHGCRQSQDGGHRRVRYLSWRYPPSHASAYRVRLLAAVPVAGSSPAEESSPHVVPASLLHRAVGTAPPRRSLLRCAGASIRLSGVVRDSIARMPLAGAVVQLVATDGLARSNRSAVSDSLGRFTLAGVPAGRYAIGFLHPILDSPRRRAGAARGDRRGNRPLRVDLATPSPLHFVPPSAGPAAGQNQFRDYGHRPGREDRTAVAGVTVAGEWLGLPSADRVLSRIPRVTVRREEQLVCHVQRAGRRRWR